MNSFQYGGIAQLGERLLCKQEVNGSIPFISTSGLKSAVTTRRGVSEMKRLAVAERTAEEVCKILAIVAERPDSLKAGEIWAYSSAG